MPAVTIVKKKFASQKAVLQNVKQTLTKNVGKTLNKADTAFLVELLKKHYPCYKNSAFEFSALKRFDVRRNSRSAKNPNLHAILEQGEVRLENMVNNDGTRGMWCDRLVDVKVNLDLLFKKVDPRLKHLDEAMDTAVADQRVQYYRCVSGNDTKEVRCSKTNVLLPSYKYARVVYKDKKQSIATLRQEYLKYRNITYDMLDVRALFAPNTKSASLWVFDDEMMEKDWGAFHLENACFAVISDAQWKREQKKINK